MASVGTAFNSPHPVRGVDDLLAPRGHDPLKAMQAQGQMACEPDLIQLKMKRIGPVGERAEKVADIGMIHRFTGVIGNEVLL